MTRGGDDLTDRLRAGFAALSVGAPTGGQPDPERIWEAAHGQLSPEEAAELAELAASDPATAEAWRLALELERPPATVSVVPIGSGRRWRWGLGLAATAVVALAVPLLHSPPWRRAPLLRDAGARVVESRLSEAGALPRGRFLLRWSAGAAGSLYDVVVSDADLEVLFRGQQLEQAELLVPVQALAPLAAGAQVLWRVEVLEPDGSRHASATFVQRVQ
jgi:hypothetical protein